MASSNYYGNFSQFQGKLSQIPAFTISTDPEHIIEIVGQGFKVAGAIVPNKTYGLEKIEQETNSKIHAYSDFYQRFTGRKYFIALSERSLARKITNTNIDNTIDSPFGSKSIYQGLHDPFQKMFSQDVLETMKKVKDQSGQLLVFPYINSPGLDTLEKKLGEGITIIAPPLKVVEYLANKAKMYELMTRKGIKTVEGYIVSSFQEAAKVFVQNQKKWGGEAFVSATGGAGGIGCLHAYSPDDIKEKFKDYNFNKKLVITKWLKNIECAPNIMIFIDDIRPHVLMISDQIIEEGTRYNGNIFPLPVDQKMMAKVEKEALRVGEVMRCAGFRGIGGIDGIIADGKFYYVEINPRKNHSSVVNISIMEQFRPKDMPPLSYLEAQLFLTDRLLSYDFEQWKKEINGAQITYDMYLLKKAGWMKISQLPEGKKIADHSWNLQDAYFANLPNPSDVEEVIIPKSYGSSKSDDPVKRVSTIEICRIVSTNLTERLKQIRRISQVIQTMEMP